MAALRSRDFQFAIIILSLNFGNFSCCRGEVLFLESPVAKEAAAVPSELITSNFRDINVAVCSVNCRQL